MSEVSIWFITFAVAVVGTWLVILRVLSIRYGSPSAGAIRAGDTELTCVSCNKPLVVQRTDLIPLSKPETALSVRAKPELAGRKLAEYVCPYCEASHCFAVDRKRPEWVGVNLYSPHKAPARCMDCGKPLRTPPWPPGAFDGHLQDAPGLQPDYGLVCSRCQAVVCVACVQMITRNRSKGGELVCPRCFRTSVDRSYHPV